MGLISSLSTLVVLVAVGLQYVGHLDALPPAVAPVVHGARLCRFYGAHAPEKLEGVPSILEKYAGSEAQLYAKLARKYEVPNDRQTTWRVDALSVLRAALELSLAAASRRSEAAGAWISAWRSQPPATKLARAAAAAAGLAHLGSPGDARGRLRGLVVFGPLVVAGVVGPSPDSFSLEKLWGGAASLLATLDAKGRAALLCGGTAAYAFFRPPPRAPIYAAGLVLAALATNPAVVDAPPGGAVTADYLVKAGLASSRRVAAKALANAPGQFKVRDFAVVSVVTCSATDTWTAPVVALGAANAWAPLGAVSLGAGDSIQVEAPLAPLYLVPALLAAAAWLALGVFDAPASARI